MSDFKQPPLASLSLTHVYYNPHDPLALLCAWLALVPQALCVSYVTLIWSTREIEILLMFAGQMSCEALNWALKRIIKEERPPQMYGKGYGMPSSHAQFVAFFSLSLSLFLLLRHSPHPRATRTPLSLSLRVLVSLAAIAGAVIVAVSRIYLNYHTPKQVALGFFAGLVSAVGWFVFTTFLRRFGFLDIILETELSQMGRWRDLVVEEDVQDAGWIRWEEKVKMRKAVHQNGGAAGETKGKKRR